MSARRILQTWLIALAAASSLLAHAQDYPNRPIRFIVSYPPGGPADIRARAMGLKLAEALGQQIVIDNRGGANGNIGAEIAAKAPADGYTIFMVTSSHAANVTLYRRPGYDLIKDFAPVTDVASYPLVLVTHPNVSAKSVRELIALAKSRPRQLTFASAGSGGGAHLAAELFCSMAGTAMVHVPYKGTGPALLDVVAGQVSLMFGGTSAVLPYAKSGRLNALGVSSSKRLALVPELPTIAESGLPGYEMTSWLGVAAPAGTPKSVVAKLNTEILATMKASDFIERMNRDAAQLDPATPETFGNFIRAEITKWAKVIRESGARID